MLINAETHRKLISDSAAHDIAPQYFHPKMYPQNSKNLESEKLHNRGLGKLSVRLASERCISRNVDPKKITAALGPVSIETWRRQYIFAPRYVEMFITHKLSNPWPFCVHFVDWPCFCVKTRKTFTDKRRKIKLHIETFSLSSFIF